ncbi:peptide deformylase [Erysipelotrichaceae bacterium MTC7]|nr:peptide deformylase [Erysipelotrichaceae bacterium MTC7]
MRLTTENIVLDSDPRIREISEEVSFPLSKEDEELIQALYQYVEESTDEEKIEKEGFKPSVGLAAIQVGKKKRMLAIVLRDENDEITDQYALINPKLISHSQQDSYLANGEGCLSVEIPHEGIVPRHARITVQAYDYLQKKDVRIRARGYVAIVMQHEMDHLDGILFYDRIKEDQGPETLHDPIVIE